jgi:hypothetical protein
MPVQYKANLLPQRSTESNSATGTSKDSDEQTGLPSWYLLHRTKVSLENCLIAILLSSELFAVTLENLTSPEDEPGEESD